MTTANSSITPQTINVPAANVVLSTAMSGTKNFDGTETVGTGFALVYTVPSTGPSQLPKLRTRYGGVNGAATSGATSASVLRIFLNNGSVNTTAANNIFWGEVDLPTRTMSNTAALTHPSDFDFGLLSLPAGWRVYAGLGTAIGGTNCGIAVSMPGGGDY